MEENWNDLINDPKEFLCEGIAPARIIIDDEDLGQLGTGVVTLYMHFTQEGMQINSKEENNVGEQKVYWLPYDKDKTNSVKIDDLEQSNCLVFLTTTFSGCRFNLKYDSVEHVPSATEKSFLEVEKKHPELNKTTSEFAALARDVSELSIDSNTENNKASRRTLTPTELSQLDYKEKHTYKASQDIDLGKIDNVVVIGVRKTMQDPFHFYGQKVDSKDNLSLIDFGKARISSTASILKGISTQTIPLNPSTSPAERDSHQSVDSGERKTEPKLKERDFDSTEEDTEEDDEYLKSPRQDPSGHTHAREINLHQSVDSGERKTERKRLRGRDFDSTEEDDQYPKSSRNTQYAPSLFKENTKESTKENTSRGEAEKSSPLHRPGSGSSSPST